MTMPDEHGARDWASGYLEWLGPRFDELFGPNGGHWYRKEMLQEGLGIVREGEVYHVPMIAGAKLRHLASGRPEAYDLMREIVIAHEQHGADLPADWEGLSDEITSGAMSRPKQRGLTGKENGVRDLIMTIMAVHLQEVFGLKLGRNAIPSKPSNTSSACEVIHDAFAEAGLHPPDHRSIEKAIRRCTAAANVPNMELCPMK